MKANVSQKKEAFQSDYNTECHLWLYSGIYGLFVKKDWSLCSNPSISDITLVGSNKEQLLKKTEEKWKVLGSEEGFKEVYLFRNSKGIMVNGYVLSLEPNLNELKVIEESREFEYVSLFELAETKIKLSSDDFKEAFYSLLEHLNQM
jgi:hypothetical protein